MMIMSECEMTRKFQGLWLEYITKTLVDIGVLDEATVRNEMSRIADEVSTCVCNDIDKKVKAQKDLRDSNPIIEVLRGAFGDGEDLEKQMADKLKNEISGIIKSMSNSHVKNILR